MIRKPDMLAVIMRIPLPVLHDLMQPECDDILNELRARLTIYETYGV